MEQTASRFLESGVWDSRLFIGTWVPGDGESYTVREPATGSRLGSVGMASAASVAAGTRSAAQAQKKWSALPTMSGLRSSGVPRSSPKRTGTSW